MALPHFIASSKSALRRSGWVLAFLPAVVPLYVIWHYHIDFIWNDSWEVANLLVKAHRQTLHLSDFWTPHLEHRMPVPYLIMFAMARLTGWNTYAEVLFGYLMVCVLSLLLAMLLRHVHSGSQDDRAPGGWVWQWFLINVLIFSPIQCENWGFGFSSCQNFLPIPCIVGGMVLLVRRGVTWRTLLAAGLLVEVAACSQANGLLGWFVLLPIVAHADSWRGVVQRKALILAWLGMAVLSFTVYLIGYKPHSLADEYGTARLVDRIQFFLVFLGTPLNSAPLPSHLFTAALGSILVAMYALLAGLTIRAWIAGNAQWVPRALPWLMVGSYALANAAMGAWGRAGMGLQQAATGRYTTISICLLVCLVGVMPLLSRQCLRGRSLARIPRVLSVLLLIALVRSAIRTEAIYVASVHERLGGKAHLSFIRLLVEPTSKRLISFDSVFVEHARVLDELGYIRPPFITDPDMRKLAAPGWDTESRRALSGAVEGGRQLPDGTIQVQGWAVLHEQGRLADAVLVTYDGPNQEEFLCAIGDVLVPEDMPIPVIGKGRPKATWVASFPSLRLSRAATRITCWAYDAELQRAYPLPGTTMRVGSP